MRRIWFRKTRAEPYAMTISSATNRSGPYACNGVTTSFPYGFKVSDAAHLRVVKGDLATGTETVLTLGSGYTVTGVDNSSGGTVVVSPAPSSAYTITVLLDVPFVQDIDLENQGAYYADTVETALDLAVQRDLQLKEGLDRAVKVPASASPSVANQLSAAIVDLANSVDEIVIVAAARDDVVTVAGIAGDVETIASRADILSGAVGAANIDEDIFLGDGATTSWPLSRAPGNKENIIVFIGGAVQSSASYDVFSASLLISPPVANGVKIIARTISAVSQSDLYPIIGHVGSHGGHPVATQSQPGFMSEVDKSKLDGVATGATANATDSQLRDRSTHSGSQAIGTVTGLQDELDGKVSVADVGTAGGVAPLDANGQVPSAHLPGYVDELIEVANYAALPATGLPGKIYYDKSTSRKYRWGGTVYAEITASPGSTDAVPEGAINLYHTPARAAAAAPVQSVAGKVGSVVLNKGDVGLNLVDNTPDTSKPLSAAAVAALADRPTTADVAAALSGKLATTHAGTGGAAHALAATGVAGFMPPQAVARLQSLDTPDLTYQPLAVASRWTQRALTPMAWKSVVWSPEVGRFVAIGSTSSVTQAAWSRDGATWALASTPVDRTWRGVCWSPEKRLFVAIGTGGVGNRVMTSPDGAVWTARNNTVDLTWNAVCWAGGSVQKFVAVAGTGGTAGVITSADGVTWVGRTALAGQWASVAYSPSLDLLVAVATASSGNQIMTSPDGVTWTARISPAAIEWTGVCWSAYLRCFVAVARTGTGNRVATSPDGITWTSRSSPDNIWSSVVSADDVGVLFAVAQSGGVGDTRIMVSADAVTWTAYTGLPGLPLAGVAWSPQLGLAAVVSSSTTEASPVLTSTPLRSRGGGACTTIAAARALPDAHLDELKAASGVVSVAFHSSIADRGGGLFMILAASEWTYPVDNNGLAFSTLSGTYVLVRAEFVQDHRIAPQWFGAIGNDSDEATKLNQWLAAYDAINATPMSTDVVAAMSPWLHVPAGVWRWGTLKKWHAKNGFAAIRGDGWNSVLSGLTVYIYNDKGEEQGAAQFAQIENVKFYGRSEFESAIVFGNGDDPAGGSAGAWDGSKFTRITNVVATHYTGGAITFWRDNHARLTNCTLNRSKYGLLLLDATDSEFIGVQTQLNTLDGIHVQPWIGSGGVGPDGTAGIGGLTFQDCNSRYNGRYNFFGTGGDPDTVISATDTAYAGVADLDFLGGSTIRVGNWWESYFDNCSFANITRGSPAPVWLTSTITSIARDTTNTAEIKVTTSTPHNFHRGLIFDNAMLQIAGTGMSYDTMAPTSGPAYVVKEVYSATSFSLNVAYTTAFSGSATLRRPQYEFVIKGQEKGYTARNIFDIKFHGKNHNFSYFERCTQIDLTLCRLKLQVVLGVNVIGLTRSYHSGITPSAQTDDNYVPVFGAGADRGWFGYGPRRFDIPWRNWSAAPDVTASNMGYSFEMPVLDGGARTDHAAGAARYFWAVDFRPTGLLFGRRDAQNDTYRGWRFDETGKASFEVDGVNKIEIDPASGTVSFAGRVAHNGDKVTTASPVPNTYMSPVSGQLSICDTPVVEEGSDAVNGTWTKFASGLMICQSLPISGVAVSTAVGSAFKSAAQTWTFPQPFKTGEVPTVDGNAHGSTDVMVSARGVSNAAAEATLFAFQSLTGKAAKLTAIGKWR